MTFKDCLAADVQQVFLNLEEFGEKRTLNGREMPAIVDSNELIERQKGATWANSGEGLYAARLLVYVRAEDYGAKPRIGSGIDLDGRRRYTVLDCTDEGGNLRPDAGGIQSAMTVIEFNFNDDWMGEISRRLGDLNDKTPDVISQATNSTARKARKLIVQSLREHYAEDAKTKEYNAAMKIARASRKKYDATIYIRGKVQNLRRFNVSPKDPPASGSSRPPTTRAQVLLQGGLKELNKGGIKAFITTFKNGDVVVAQRNGSFTPTTARPAALTGTMKP